MRDFTVKKDVRGYVVTIGCQVAGFSTKEDLRDALTEYISDPEGAEKKYYDKSIIQDVCGAGNKVQEAPPWPTGSRG